MALPSWELPTVLGAAGSHWAPVSLQCPVLPPLKPPKAKYQEAPSPPQTLSHQEHLLGHLLGHLGDSVPAVRAAVLQGLVQLSTQRGRATRGWGRAAARLLLWGEDRAGETPTLAPSNRCVMNPLPGRHPRPHSLD